MTRHRVFVIGVCSLILVAVVVSVAISAFKRKLDDSRSPVAAGNAFSSSIKVLCGGMPYPDACNESLTRAANGTVLDPAAVFLLAVHVSITELDNASAVIEGLALNSSPDNYTAAVLAECGDLTGFAVEHLDDTLLATNLTSAETVEDLKAWLSESITDQVTCVDDMEGASAAVKAAVIEEALTNSTIFASKVLANYNEIPGLFGQFKHRRLMSSSTNFPSWISLADRILLQSKKDAGVAEEIEDLKAWLSATITDQVTCVDDMEGASAAVKAAAWLSASITDQVPSPRDSPPSPLVHRRPPLARPPPSSGAHNIASEKTADGKVQHNAKGAQCCAFLFGPPSKHSNSGAVPNEPYISRSSCPIVSKCGG